MPSAIGREPASFEQKRRYQFNIFVESWYKDYANVGITYVEALRELYTQFIIRVFNMNEQEIEHLNTIDGEEFIRIYFDACAKEGKLSNTSSHLRALIAHDYIRKYGVAEEQMTTEELVLLLIADTVEVASAELNIRRLKKTCIDLGIIKEGDISDPYDDLVSLRNRLFSDLINSI